MNLIKPVRGIAALLLMIAIGLGVYFAVFRRGGLPVRKGEKTIPGLSAEVKVRFDAFGVPHIEAQQELDLARALGYLHANDRITQLELGRRAVQGRLSELMGERTLEIDIYFRTLRLGETAAMLERHASPRSREWLEAYAEGVNTWLRERAGNIGPELRLVDAEPEPWKPRDSLGFALLMARDLSFWDDHPEEERFLWLRAFGLEGTRELMVAPTLAAVPAIEEAARAVGKPAGPRTTPEVLDLAAPGSNNWALGGSRTASGKAMLAGDPHLGLRLPSVWYQVLLRSPTFEVAGMSLPGTPGVIIGRGKNIAWSFTNTQLDDQDIFFEELDPTGKKVRRGDKWVDILEREEKIEVKDGETRTLKLRSTDIGPLFEADEGRGLPARSLAWTGHQPADPVAALYALAQSATPEEAMAAIEPFTCPAQNLVAAFADGSLLHTVIGRIPDRRQGDGRLPSPGWDTAYGWNGLRPRETNPTRLRPADDLLVTANNDIRPADYALPLSADFMGPARAERIRTRLLDQPTWTREQVAALQVDDVSLYARWIVAALAKGAPYGGDAGRAFEVLKAWDGKMDVTGPSALFILAQRRLLIGFFGDEQAVHGLPKSVGDRATLQAILQGDISDRFADDLDTPAKEGVREIVERALGEAWRDVVSRYQGEDPKSWDYGTLHSLTLRHPLDAAPIFGPWMRRGPFKVPGSAETVLAFGARWQRDGNQSVTYGPSMRWVVDWGQPEQAWAVLPGGQSGHPSDPHYDDQIALYLRGELKPAPWSEAAIEAATKHRLVLKPGAP